MRVRSPLSSSFSLALRTSLAVLCVSIAGVGGSGCAHVVRIDSAPAGADVVVEGAPVCRTPCDLPETTGGTDVVTVEVRRGDQAVRFGYQKAGFATGPVIAGLAGAAGLFLVGTAGASGLAVIGELMLISGNPLGAAPLLLAYVLGAAAAYAPFIPVWAAGYGARAGPESIHVNLATGKVTSIPGDRIVPFLGRLPSTPLRKPAPVDAPAAPALGAPAPAAGSDGEIAPLVEPNPPLE